jgi:hypothetical protein
VALRQRDGPINEVHRDRNGSDWRLAIGAGPVECTPGPGHQGRGVALVRSFPTTTRRESEARPPGGTRAAAFSEVASVQPPAVGPSVACRAVPVGAAGPPATTRLVPASGSVPRAALPVAHQET